MEKLPAKKPAAKKKAAPVEEKTIAFTAIPPMPVMQLAAVAVADKRMTEISARLKVSSDFLRKAAGTYRDLCRGGACFSCGNTLNEGQLASITSRRIDDVMLCPCLNKLRDGYVEHVPGWQGKQRQILVDLQDLKSGKRKFDPTDTTHFAGSDVLYSDRCKDCKTRFSIKAETAAIYIEKYGTFKPMMRCHKCGNEMRDRMRNLKKTDNVVAEKPSRYKNPKKHLTATVAEQTESKQKEVIG